MALFRSSRLHLAYIAGSFPGPVKNEVELSQTRPILGAFVSLRMLALIAAGLVERSIQSVQVLCPALCAEGTSIH